MDQTGLYDEDVSDLPRLPPVPRTPHDWQLRPRLRRVVLVVFLLFMVYVVQTRVVTQVVFQQRQEHLAAALATPTPIVEQGKALGYLQIPTIGLDDVMVEGVTTDHLRSGPAHRSETALPGDAGPMVVYGHRQAYGGPFRKITQLKEGDSVIAQAASGGPIVQYVVQSVERHTQVSAIKLDKPDQIAYLLLVTAESGWFADDVSVVVARALPVTDAAPSAVDLSHGPDRGSPLSLAFALGDVSAVGAALAWRFLKGRSSTAIRVLIVLPIALYAAISVITAVESIFPIAN